MNLPFTTEQFFSVFEAYNQAIWPAQVLSYLLGFLIIIAIFKQTRWAGRFISGVLAFFWVWMGAAYHIAYFSRINPAAIIFGVLFITPGLLLIVFGVVLNRYAYGVKKGLTTIVGFVFIAYSMLFYPLLGYIFGHRYPGTPMFGVAPCPTTIFTFGVFLFGRTVIPYHQWSIPLIWSLVGMGAALSLQVPQDYGLVASGVVGTIFVYLSNRKPSFTKIGAPSLG